MGFVVLIFWAIVLFDAGNALWAGEYLHGALAVLGSLLAFAAGAGFRGSLHLKNPIIPSAIFGMALLGGSLAIMQQFDLTIDLVDGRVWAFIGAFVGFLAATKDDALPREQASSEMEGEAPEVNPEDIFSVVSAYGRIIEQQNESALPLTMLPLPKDQMKTVLKLAWVAVNQQSGKDAVEAGYSYLAHFREGIDSPISYGLDELRAAAEKQDLNSETLKGFSDRVSLFDEITAESLILAREFDEFKSSLTN